jgi:FtsP/CotA-like multicopper oxidase with cupredoxin domain
VYKKAVYIGYVDDTYKQPLQREPWLGILGPLLRLNAGDVLHVHLFNNASRPYSFYPHALAYIPPTTDDLLRKGVPAGQKATLTFKVPSVLAQGRIPSFWLYHSHVDEVRDTMSGLFGGIVVYPRGMDIPKREFANVFVVVDENLSWYMDENKKRATVVKEDADWVESNQKHSMNGLLFANVEGMTMQLGERVLWYVASLGGEKDLHTAHWHGASLLHQGHRVDVADLLPGETQVLEMTPDVVGKWLYHCHVNDHVVSGMSAYYEVVDTAAKPSSGVGRAPTAVLFSLLLAHVFH